MRRLRTLFFYEKMFSKQSHNWLAAKNIWSLACFVHLHSPRAEHYWTWYYIYAISKTAIITIIIIYVIGRSIWQLRLIRSSSIDCKGRGSMHYDSIPHMIPRTWEKHSWNKRMKQTRWWTRHEDKADIRIIAKSNCKRNVCMKDKSTKQSLTIAKVSPGVAALSTKAETQITYLEWGTCGLLTLPRKKKIKL